jgi:uncharacterized protein YjiS (DUF1127 family)
MTYQHRQEHFTDETTSVALNTDLEEYIAKGRLLRAQAVAALFTAAAKGIARRLRSGVSTSIDLGRRAISWLAREHQRRAGLRALMALDDHMLKDIGLSRGEIHSMVNGVFRSPETGQSRQAKALTLVVNKEAVSDDNVRRAA